jgi:endonuclease-8
MPEGPSIVILKEQAGKFRGKKVTSALGNSNADIDRAIGQTVIDFKSWGKHFLICFANFTIRIHMLLFGSYRVDEERDRPPRLSLQFKNGTLNFYACSVKIIDENLDEVYDWKTDVMSDSWDPRAAKVKLLRKPKMLACDALLDQNIFAGSGNIIKNEVLYRVRVHPLSQVQAIPSRRLSHLVNATREYSFDFLKWKKAFVLRKHWLVHTKRTCPRCERGLTKEYLGRHQRRSFFCTNCQKLYR